MMPGMNGIETLRALKSAKTDLQVVMLNKIKSCGIDRK
jgi:DNA-binding NarL/FixJ family response regulator